MSKRRRIARQLFKLAYVLDGSGRQITIQYGMSQAETAQALAHVIRSPGRRPDPTQATSYYGGGGSNREIF